MKRALAGLVLIATLGACEGGGDPVEQALRDAAAERQAALVKDGEVSGPEAPHADPKGDDVPWGGRPTRGDYAFRATEEAMHANMAAASGSTVDEAYIAKMIEHHRGAVAMAEVALKESKDPEVRRMARVVIDAQTREIAQMQAWRPKPGPAQ